MSQGSILLVDDDQSALSSMRDYLNDENFSVTAVTDYTTAIGSIRRQPPDIVITDVALGDQDGFDLLKWCQNNDVNSPVILLTGFGTIEGAVEAMRLGAVDYLTKPFSGEMLTSILRRALSKKEASGKSIPLPSTSPDTTVSPSKSLIGLDQKMVEIFDLIRSVSDTRSTVLITGESGTGKSLCARAIHQASSRSAGPFVEVACGAIPETLLESELFGHSAGSFTGAIADREGKFQQADGGTIFLDEIATASPALQVKLLRVLQNMEFEPVGSTKTRQVNARVILATNEDLKKRVMEGTFRQDLFYRINVVTLEVPPLRERLEDIASLTDFFLEKFKDQTGKPVQSFSDQALAALEKYLWPGNVRELENVIERAVVLGKSDILGVNDLPSHLLDPSLWQSESYADRTLKQALTNPERKIILEALESHNWNRQKTAAFLGINRTTLYKKIRKLGLEQSNCKLM